MTTIRDLVNDLAEDLADKAVGIARPEDWEEQKEVLIDEFINIIIDRYIG